MIWHLGLSAAFLLFSAICCIFNVDSVQFHVYQIMWKAYARGALIAFIAFTFGTLCSYIVSLYGSNAFANFTIAFASSMKYVLPIPIFIRSNIMLAAIFGVSLESVYLPIMRNIKQMRKTEYIRFDMRFKMSKRDILKREIWSSLKGLLLRSINSTIRASLVLEIVIKFLNANLGDLKVENVGIVGGATILAHIMSINTVLCTYLR